MHYSCTHYNINKQKTAKTTAHISENANKNKKVCDLSKSDIYYLLHCDTLPGTFWLLLASVFESLPYQSCAYCVCYSLLLLQYYTCCITVYQHRVFRLLDATSSKFMHLMPYQFYSFADLWSVLSNSADTNELSQNIISHRKMYIRVLKTSTCYQPILLLKTSNA